MIYLFMEESGDLGFSKGSSRWFLFVAVITDNPRSLEKIHQKVWRTLRNKRSHPNELHATHESDIIRKRVFQLIEDSTNLKIAAVILDKKNIHRNLREDKQHLYNAAGAMLMDALGELGMIPDDMPLYICIDRRETNESLRNDFARYFVAWSQRVRFELIFSSSHEQKALQIADFISWAIFRSYERNDHQWYHRIQKHIISETVISL